MKEWKDNINIMLLFRFNYETGEITLTTDRWPYRGLNEDYGNYLLSALINESWECGGLRCRRWKIRENSTLPG